MLQYQEKTTVVSNQQLGPDTFRMTLAAPKIAKIANPGQFVMVRVHPTSNDPLLRRPFSIHRVGDDGILQLYYRVVGRGTKELSEVKKGVKLDTLGPLGHGFTLAEDRPVCVIGGGIGIAPMLFLVERLAQRAKRYDTDAIILGGRTSSDVSPVFEDFKRFGLAVTTATDDGSFGRTGRVTDILEELDPPSQTLLYACGPEPMLAAVSRYASLHSLECQVSVESSMACGIGACLGCNRLTPSGAYTHVCVDGPVFSSQELQWKL